MNQRRRLKQETRRSLKGNWGKAVALTVVLLLIPALCTVAEDAVGMFLELEYFEDSLHTPKNHLDNTLYISPAVFLLFVSGTLISFLLSAPLRLGAKGWYLHLVAHDPKPLSDAFRYYTRPSAYLQAVLFETRLFFRRSVLILISFLPAILFYLSLPFLEQLSIPNLLFSLLTTVMLGLLCLLGSAVCLLWVGRTFLAEYLYFLYSCKMREAFYLSAKIMKGRKSVLFSLRLSFLPLAVAELLILPRLWTTPYKTAVLAQYARYFMESYEREKSTATLKSTKPQAERFLTKEFPCPS